MSASMTELLKWRLRFLRLFSIVWISISNVKIFVHEEPDYLNLIGVNC